MSLTAVLAAHLLGLGRRLKIALWVWFGLTILSTVYFGWHYFLDDIAGIVIAVGALLVARRSPASTCARCGSRRARRSRRPTEPDGEQRCGREHDGGHGHQEPRGAGVGALPIPCTTPRIQASAVKRCSRRQRAAPMRPRA